MLPVWIAIAGGCGYAPLAPGTAGSLAAATLFGAVCYWAATSGHEPELVWVLGTGLTCILVVCALGTWASARAEIFFGRHDDGRIVIDEVAGQWITLLPVLFFLPVLSTDLFSLFFAVVTGFVLFRVFDIWKPGAIRWAERRFTGGWGVMADDIVAGIHGACLLGFGLSYQFGFQSGIWLGTAAVRTTAPVAALKYLEGAWA